jgi:uncharacterized repeat protein (TIGR03803 family)
MQAHSLGSRASGRVLWLVALALAAFPGPWRDAEAATLTTLYAFCADSAVTPCADGEGSGFGLTFDTSGNLFGVSEGGGNDNAAGLIFEIPNGGSYEVIYSFCPTLPCPDGSSPFSNLVFDKSGNLYGTVSQGGANSGGAIFKLAKGGSTPSVIYSFCAVNTPVSCVDGNRPQGLIALDAKGNLFGATFSGGASGDGTIFEFSHAGLEAVLYSFCNVNTPETCADGKEPALGATFNGASSGKGYTDGTLYGSTSSGGTDGSGVVFTFNPKKKKEAVALNFGGTSLSGTIYVTVDAKGDIFGVSESGGANSDGAIFSVGKSGASILYSFCSLASCADGSGPGGPLLIDKAGNLWGTTRNGGANGAGSVFMLKHKAKQLTTVYSFCSVNSPVACADGSLPAGALTYAAAAHGKPYDGKSPLFGVTLAQGANSFGTIFSLAP